jgi:hypothetical protein
MARVRQRVHSFACTIARGAVLNGMRPSLGKGAGRRARGDSRSLSSPRPWHGGQRDPLQRVAPLSGSVRGQHQAQSSFCLQWVCAVIRRRFPVGESPTRQKAPAGSGPSRLEFHNLGPGAFPAGDGHRGPKLHDRNFSCGRPWVCCPWRSRSWRRRMAGAADGS